MTHHRFVSDVENQLEDAARGQPSSNGFAVSGAENLRLRGPLQPSPLDAKDGMPSMSDDAVEELQVVSIPDHPEAPKEMATPAASSQTSSEAPKTLHPDLPNSRTSTSIDSPNRDNVTKGLPSFTELKKQHGLSNGSLQWVLQFSRHNWGILLFLLVVAIGLAVLGIFAFDPISWKAWLAFAIFILTLSLLISNAVATPLAMLIGLTAMLVFQIVSPTDAIEGFSNTGVMSVAVLYIVAEGIQRTSVLTPVFRIVLGKPRYTWEAQLRVMIPVAIVSAFLNNTPLVAMLIPVVQSWSRRANFAISKLLMPLNNAAVLGGTLTLLGTSTNLVVDGLAREELTTSSDSPVALPIFGILPLGAVSLVAGLVYMLIFSRFLLRDRGQSAAGAINRNPREYTVALLVQGRSPIVGDTILEAGLRHLQGLYLVEITRADGTLIPAAGPETKIEAGDILLFAGVVETVTELYHIPGLVPATGQSQKIRVERHHRRLIELVISSSSVLVGKTAKESEFRSRFSAAIIAVHRHGEHVKERIADIMLRPGDTLLVEAGADFTTHYGKDSNFALVSEVSGSQPPREDKLHMLIAAVLTITMIALASTKVLPLLAGASAVSLIMIATGCLTVENAVRAVNLGVIITIAASFGISKGMEGTGAAGQLANFIVNVFKPLGDIGLLFGIYVSTALLSSVITNNAAVALMFPVILGILKTRGLVNDGGVVQNEPEVLRTLYTLMIGASSCFSTPIGYQTNLMVHGPGGYTFMDWVVFGIPMQIVLCIAGVVAANFMSFSL